MFKLTRHTSNPVLEPSPDLAWEKEGIFNPGVVHTATVDGECVTMLYRAVGERDAYISHIGLAKSKDGIHFERHTAPTALKSSPVFGPSTAYDKWATEDPRITQIEDDFYITYVAVPERIMDHNTGIERVLPLETATALLRTKDFLTFEHLGIISPLHSDNKDIVLFPKKIKTPTNSNVSQNITSQDNAPQDSTSQNMRYAMLHRPNRWDKKWFAGEYKNAVQVPLPCAREELPTLPSIWIAWSDDLIHWTDHRLLLSPSHQSDAKIGPGLPPIETKDGWLMIYHHVEKVEAVAANPERYIYSVRAALLDLEDPMRIIGKLPYDILYPETPYETKNDTHIVFPTGGFVSAEGILYVYYGASDFSIGLATGSVEDLLTELKKEGIAKKTRHETV